VAGAGPGVARPGRPHPRASSGASRRGKAPLFAAVVVLVLALGIGATTAIFTLVDAVLLSPLPFPDADRLVTLSHSAPTSGAETWGSARVH